MNKFKRLTKRVGIEAAILVGVLGVCGGIMAFTGSLIASATEKKTQAESALSQDNSQLATLRSQLERSGEAEKRFVEIQLARTNPDFTSNTESLTEWMRNAKSRYRFANNFKLNLPPEHVTDKAELGGLDFLINVRDGITLELEAMSDTYVYSFLQEMLTDTPGFIRVTGFEVERRSELDAQTYTQIMGGMAPSNVAAKIRFNWVGINAKPNPLKDAQNGAPGVPTP